MSTITVKDSAYGGPGNIFKVTLTAELDGPSVSQIRKGGKFFQMTAKVYADVEATDPVNPSLITQWSQSTDQPPPMAIQEVRVDPYAGPPVQWSNRELEGSLTSENIAVFYDGPNVGTMTTIVRFENGTARVTSIWGKLEWEEFTYHGVLIPSGNAIVNVNTTNLEWDFSAVRTPSQ